MTRYAKSLAETLSRIVCSDKAHSINILRGILANGRIADANEATPALVEFIVSGACPLGAKLTPDDVALLRAREAD
jgi:hypothetical protein